MKSSDPTQYLWWLVSRASGIVAVALISVSVLLGLAMAAKLLPTRFKRTAIRMHEYLAMTSLLAIGLHGAALLGDGWLKPGLGGITIPFALSYRPAFTAAGIIAGYLALLLGPSFYLRRRIGARRWRKLHRATAIVWLLSVVHTLGAGSDGSTLWLRCIVLAPAAPIVYALVLRIFGTRSPAAPAHGRAHEAPASHRARRPEPLAAGSAVRRERRPDSPASGTGPVPRWERRPEAAPSSGGIR